MTLPTSKVALKPFQKRTLYLVSALLWLSGTLWLYFRYFGQAQGAFGPEPPPAQAASLKIHGAAAMAFLVVLGALIPNHVQLGWRTKRLRPSGASLLALCAILTATGWGLYYIGGDSPRFSTSVVHSVLGILFPLLIVLHVWLSGRKSRAPASRKLG